MSQPFIICSICTRATAVIFCPCNNQETLLCYDCIPTHKQKSTARNHKIIPIQHRPYYRIPGYDERLQTRMDSIGQIREQALHSLTEVDRIIEEVNSRAEAEIWEIMASARRTIAELNEVKEQLTREIHAGLEEVEKTLVEDQPELLTQYGPILRQLTQNPRAFSFFKFDIRERDPQTTPSRTFFVTRHIKDYSKTQFAMPYGKSVAVYNLQTSASERQDLTVDFKEGGSFIELGRTVLCFGGSPASTQVYSLDLRSFQLTPLMPLNMPRKAPGTARATSFIYIFGGKDSANASLIECEKWSMQDQVHSTMLSSMRHPRAFFTPCSYRALVYLVSADAHRAIETFSPTTEAFSLLSVSLPAAIETGAYSVAFIATEELVMLTSRRQMARWKIDSAGQAVLERTDRGCWSGQLPVVRKNKVLIACEGRVQKFSLRTYSFNEENLP